MAENEEMTPLLEKLLKKMEKIEKDIEEIKKEQTKPILRTTKRPVPGMASPEIKPRILSDAIRQVRRKLEEKEEGATATEIAQEMNKSRALISSYLNRLYYIGAVEKEKREDSPEVVFRVVRGANLS